MADVGHAVHTYLQSKPTVTALASSRGYPNNAPESETGTLYVYAEISTDEQQHLGSSSISGIATTRVQVDAWSNDYLQASALAEQIRQAMLATRPITMGALTVDKVLRDGKFTDAHKPIDGSDGWRHRVSQDFLLTHNEDA